MLAIWLNRAVLNNRGAQKGADRTLASARTSPRCGSPRSGVESRSAPSETQIASHERLTDSGTAPVRPRQAPEAAGGTVGVEAREAVVGDPFRNLPQTFVAIVALVVLLDIGESPTAPSMACSRFAACPLRYRGVSRSAPSVRTYLRRRPEAALSEPAHLSSKTADTVLDDYEHARIVDLRSALAILAVLAIAALFLGPARHSDQAAWLDLSSSITAGRSLAATAQPVPSP